MNTDLQLEATIEAPKKTLTIKVVGVGRTGVNVLDQMAGAGMASAGFVAVNTDAQSLAASCAAEKVHLETKPLRGLGTGGDPEQGRALVEDYLPRFKSLCEGADVVFIIAGLGGGAGTGISPVLARAAKETGALVLGFVTTPFECEGSRRQRLARAGLEELRTAADGVICLPNQKLLKLIDENTSVLETFKLTNELLADGVRGIWRLLTQTGLIEIHFEDLCALLRDRHTESAFAVAESMGATRSREVIDKLFAHPMLEGGKALDDSDSVLVSVMGGADLTMAEINRIMEQINQHCKGAQVIMGASIDEGFRDRLAVTLIAARKSPEREASEAAERGSAEELSSRLLKDSDETRPGSRFVPPPPETTEEELNRLMERKAAAGGSRGRKTVAKMRQTQLPLEIVSKGRFDKSEPTIHKGEDLDVPTYIRRGVALN